MAKRERRPAALSSTAVTTRWDAIRSDRIVVPATETFGFVIEPVEDPSAGVRFTWTVPHDLCNAAGNLQGGVVAAFADAALGGAISAHLPEDQYPALAEMKISIFRPAPAGASIEAVGWVVKKGRRLIFAEAEVRDHEGLVIAKASATEVPATAERS